MAETIEAGLLADEYIRTANDYDGLAADRQAQASRHLMTHSRPWRKPVACDLCDALLDAARCHHALADALRDRATSRFDPSTRANFEAAKTAADKSSRRLQVAVRK